MDSQDQQLSITDVLLHKHTADAQHVTVTFDHPLELDKTALWARIFTPYRTKVIFKPNPYNPQKAFFHTLPAYVASFDKNNTDTCYNKLKRKWMIIPDKRELYLARKAKQEAFSHRVLDYVLCVSPTFINLCAKDLQTAANFFAYYHDFFQVYGKGYETLLPHLGNQKEFETAVHALKLQLSKQHSSDSVASAYYNTIRSALNSQYKTIPIQFPDGKTATFPMNKAMFDLPLEGDSPDVFLFKHLVYLLAPLLGFIDFETVSHLLQLMFFYPDAFLSTAPQDQASSDPISQEHPQQSQQQ